MLDYHEALTQLLDALPGPVGGHDLPLAQCVGRVLANSVVACQDTPLFDNSAMDGYAVADTSGHLTTFTVVDRIAAGDAASSPLREGEAARIFTGAPVPAGATAVVPQEQTQRDGTLVHMEQAPRAGSNIRRRAEEYAAGAVLLAPGTVLDAAAIALAASQGHACLSVTRPLRVMVFSSGNELRQPGETLAAGQIWDANRYQLLAWLAGLSVEVIDGGILPDEASVTRMRLQEAVEQADVVLTSGGVSVGEEDHVRAALEAIGHLEVWKLAIKPGKPFAWGTAGRAHVFMLPGNPVATFVTFHQMVAPALRRLQGQPASAVRPASFQAVSSFARSKREPRREFLRAVMTPCEDGRWAVRALQGQGSAMLSACVEANALVEVPPDTPVREGDLLTVYPLPLKSWSVSHV